MSEHSVTSAQIAQAVHAALQEQAAPSLSAVGRELGRITRELRAHRLSAAVARQRPPQDEWLCDNYYVLERESKQIQREVRQLARGGRRQTARFLRAVQGALDLLPPLEEETLVQILGEIQAQLPLDEEQFAFLPGALKIALLRLAHRACLEWRRDTEIAYAVVGLGKLTAVDFDEVVSRCSPVEELLRLDPAGVYSRMDTPTKQHYRYLVSKIARQERKGETQVARELLESARDESDGARRHVGWRLLRHPSLLHARQRRGRLVLAAGIVLPLLSSAALAVACSAWWLFFLCFLPLWEVFRPLLHQWALAGMDVDFLPRMDLDKAGERPKTAVIISTLLPKAADAPALGRRLEQLHYSNADPRLHYCVLADLTEWDFPTDEKDESQIAACRRVIEDLNRRYGDRFCLFLRGRVYNATQKRYSGWERKRGAITEWVRFLKGEPTSLHTFVGSRQALEDVRYLIALDADTNLLYEGAQTLVSVAMHPLNRPVIGPDGLVHEGYGILAPKISTDLDSARATPFSRILSGCGGVTAYDTRDKDFYQDLFGESIFAGKGLIDVEAFHQLLDQRFPENQVLSHDILEGAYLRCGFVSDVEMTDQAPSSMTSWLSRLHRWVRGDWQNLPFFFQKLRIEGTVWHNPITTLSRYKLFDNLRRSLTPLTALLCLIAALLCPPPARTALALVGVLAVTFPSLWAAVCALLSGGLFTLSRRFFTRTLSHVFELVAQALFLLVMTPAQAFLTLDGAARSLWRTYVSRRRMLEWTTAAQSDARRTNLAAALRRYWLPQLFGLLYLAAGLDSLLSLAGLAFSLVLPLALYTARPSEEERHALTPADRDALISYNAAMWRYYEDFADEANHYLPPDNIQQSPVYRVAARTSPTNIGMMLLSVLAAWDLDLIDTDGLYLRIERTLRTVEGLRKWHGNLYNWYDTETLELLHPAFVSTVDSGNFICCLVALREGLLEFAGEQPRFAELAGRVARLVGETDLAPFYNKKKKLFSIGWDADSGELSGSHYDFLMSEARLTSYYAVARKVVGKKHWGAMARTMSRTRSYAGPVSWTGTMFEYYMPHLLLPVYEGSLLCEALTYCLYCQKRRGKEKDVPWGVSESAFYSFDNNLNYQYKAHGVQKLGVKRDLDRELVVSPYSTFITIPQNPNSSMENLRRLRKLGVYGRYGFYEAVDFTPERVRPGDLAVTRSYMAHHIGMSMIASCNALFEGRMQRRFMRDPYMGSAREFLQEKIAKSTVVYDELRVAGLSSPKQERPRRAEESSDIFPLAPRCALLTNGELTDVLCDSGPGYLKFGEVNLTRHSEDLIRQPQGFVALVRAGGHTIPVTKSPFFDDTVAYSVEYQEQSVTYFAQKKGWEAGMRCLIHPTLSCEQRQLVVKNRGSKKETAQILLYFEPVLSPPADYSAHPAYSKLFVTAAYDPGTRTITYTRRTRDGGGQIYLTVGFLQDQDFSFETRREQLMEAPAGVGDLRHFHRRAFSDNGGGVPDACCAIRLELAVAGGGQSQATLLLSAARSREEGISNIVTMRKAGALEPRSAARSPLLADTLEGRLGCNLLGSLLFAQGTPCQNEADKLANRLDQSGLWGCGISGDVPLVLLEEAEELDEDTLGAYLRLHGLLRNRSLEFDLCILYGEEHARETLDRRVAEAGSANLLGARGGVFLLQKDSLAPETRTLLRAVARHIHTLRAAPTPAGDGSFAPLRPQPSQPAPLPDSPELAVHGGVCLDGGFAVDKTSPLPYCHVLASPVFGTLVSDRALGYTWAYNSRENKLTPWHNDICADNQGELCLLRLRDQCYDLVNGARATFLTGERPAARYQGTAGGLESLVEVTVAAKGCAKYIDVTLRNPGDREVKLDLAYYTEPVLGVTRSTARFVQARMLENSLVLHNAYSIGGRCHMALTPRRWEGDHLTDLGGICMTGRSAFWSGSWKDDGLRPQEDPCAAVIIPLRLPPRRDARIRFILSAGRTARGAATMARLSPPLLGDRGENAIAFHTPEEPLNQLINHFLPHQILSSRIRGRCAFYQCGGAYGFRDQLQDAAAYLLRDPDVARRQIVRCCGAQFEEGDVLHWWHDLPGGIKGVRTRFSDDLLWLPLIAAEYVQKTGDRGALELPVAYLQAEELPPGVQERYLTPARSSLRESVFHHCRRALDRGYRVDERGLPYIGCGDWNDGFSAVGREGRGVSVWLALFLVRVLEAFAPLCQDRGESGLAEKYRGWAVSLRQAVDDHCWDGDHYLRAFFDNGRPMGGRDCGECAIDLLPQSFAVLSGMPDEARVDKGLDSAWERLVDHRLQLVRLFDPPFQHGEDRPGYVRAYPSGLRENGGQYTHSAIWFAQALLERGRAGQGWQVLRMLSPLHRAQQPQLAERYRLEPYCLAADIYTNPSAPGRGGWSLYTGAASWYYRVAVETLAGIRLEGDRVRFAPCLPPEWQECRVTAVFSGTGLDIHYAREPGRTRMELLCDGRPADSVPLDGAPHTVRLLLPGEAG